MKYSDVVKTILLTTINDLSANPEKFAVRPGNDFYRDRKLSFKSLLLMLLTIEADCIKEEIYRYFGRSTDAPSKAAFYKQRKRSTGQKQTRPLFLYVTGATLLIMTSHM